jgi:hypothetical protein
MRHAAVADLVARCGDDYKVGISQLRVGEAGHRQEAGDAGRALAGAGEPARHRCRHDDRAAAPAAAEAADDVAARHVVAIAALDVHSHRPARLLGGVEQRLVPGGDQDHRRRPRLALLVDVVGVDLATRVIDGQQHGGGTAGECDDGCAEAEACEWLGNPPVRHHGHGLPIDASEPASKSYCRPIVKFCGETAKPARKSSPAIQSKACAAPAEP